MRAPSTNGTQTLCSGTWLAQTWRFAGIHSLRTYISVIEPVKHYDRGGQQVWMNQLVPLIGIADAAKPESEVSRLFAAQVDEALFAPGTD
jgi:hypothetical protein